MRVFRIVSEKWVNSLSGSGFPARWNIKGKYVVYTASSRSLACLEMLVHLNGAKLRNDFFISEIDIPESLRISEITLNDLPGEWRKGNFKIRSCQNIGNEWLGQNRTAVLKVPSVIVPEEFNYIINPNHPDSDVIKILNIFPFTFDNRLL